MELCEDVIIEITSYLDAVSIVRFLSTNKRFWDFRKKPFIVDRIQPFQKHIKYQQWNFGLTQATKRSNFPQIEFFLKKGVDDMSSCLAAAAETGCVNLTNFFLKLSARDKSHALIGAAKGGHKHLVDLEMPMVFSDGRSINWDLAFSKSQVLRTAVLEGHLELAKHLMERWKATCDSLSLLAYATIGGHRHMVDFFISLLDEKLRWEPCMEHAIENGHYHLVDFFLTKPVAWDRVLTDRKNGKLYLRKAARSGKKELVDWIISKGVCDWNEGLNGASEGGSLSLARFFVEKGANRFDDALRSAARYGHLEVVKYLLEHACPTSLQQAMLSATSLQQAMLSPTSLQQAMLSASCSDHREVIQALMEYGASASESVIEAAAGGHVGLINYICQATEVSQNHLQLALFAAVSKGYLNTTKCLVSFGAAKDPDTLEGAKEEATNRGQTSIAAYLQTHSSKRFKRALQ